MPTSPNHFSSDILCFNNSYYLNFFFVCSKAEDQYFSLSSDFSLYFSASTSNFAAFFFKSSFSSRRQVDLDLNSSFYDLPTNNYCFNYEFWLSRYLMISTRFKFFSLLIIISFLNSLIIYSDDFFRANSWSDKSFILISDLWLFSFAIVSFYFASISCLYKSFTFSFSVSIMRSACWFFAYSVRIFVIRTVY